MAKCLALLMSLLVFFFLTTCFNEAIGFQGLDSHYGTKGLRKVTVDCHNGGKVTFQFSYAAGI